MTEWVIAGPVDDQEKLYWSNDIGWVSLAIATVFPHTDFDLPTFGMEGIDVRWMRRCEMENPIDWSETINSDVIDEMDAETLEKVLTILDKIE